MDKTITMSQFRQEPGEYVRAVHLHGRSFVLTKSGQPVARLCPVSDTTVITSDGVCHGEIPLTARMTKKQRG